MVLQETVFGFVTHCQKKPFMGTKGDHETVKWFITKWCLVFRLPA